jgi:hypothetical protein
MRGFYGALLRTTTCNEFVVHHSIYGRSTYDMARIAQCATNIGRRLRLGLEPGRQCPIRLTKGISLTRAKSVEKNRIR